MTEKKFSVAGVSTLEGKTKIRFANDAMRIKILTKNGHTDIELADLPHEMTKAEIAQYLEATDFARGRDNVAAAIADLAKKNGVNKSVQVTATKAETVAA